MGTRLGMALVALAVLAGCQSGGGARVDEGALPPLPPASAPKYQDVPVPFGFEYLPTKSFSTEGVGYRVGELIYKGSANALEVMKFYREQMPPNGWVEVREADIGSRAILLFKKQQESCIVIIERGSLLSSTMVRVWIH